jgi:quercetin dioxygenase-like cupin family protein
MTATELITSGILESYCLGFTNREENDSIREMAEQYSDVKQEIAKIKKSLSAYLVNREIQPSASVKTGVMHTIYAQQAVVKREFVPLMHRNADFTGYYEAAAANQLVQVSEPFGDIYVKELPSTNEIINFAVWVKNGHEEEAHPDRNEYIAILEGSCDMFMNGIKKSYSKGEIICIEAGVLHHAVITSSEPMFALVQRQLIL